VAWVKKPIVGKRVSPPPLFFYWIKKLALQNQSFSPPSAAGFTELILPAHMQIPAAEVNSGGLVLEIAYPSGTSLKFYQQVEASFIKSLL
jgi:hypothetical protein